MINCIKRAQIDSAKWDDCVRSSPNGRLYAMSYYLDLVCHKGGWLGLVDGDYHAVMPLPLNDRLPLLTRITLPIFAQQLGIFTSNTINEKLVSRFIAHIPTSYRSVYLQFNDAHPIQESTHSDIHLRSNFTLALNKPYEELYAKFSKNLKRNIKIAAKNELCICEIGNQEFAQFYLSRTEKKVIIKLQLNSFLPSLISTIIAKKHGKVWGVKNAEGHLLGACLLTNFNGRITYLLSRSTQEGKSKRTMHFIINEIIKEYADKSILLDFEGSEIESIANFFQFFGAIDTPYPVLSYARFPFKKTVVSTKL